MDIDKYQCIKSSQHIPIANPIQKTHVCINVQNNNQYCLKWAIISAMYPIYVHSNRTTSYKINNISNAIITLENGIVLILNT